jgi:competence protein ComEC
VCKIYFPSPASRRGVRGEVMLYQFIVSFIVGIVLEKIFNFGWSVGLLIFLVSVFIFLYFKRESYSLGKIIFVIGVALCAGILRMGFSDTTPDANLSKLTGQKISFEATVLQEPDVRETSARYTVSVDQISLRGDSQNKKFGSEVILIADRFPELQYGDKIKVSGKLDLPKNFAGDNGAEFDYISYLAKDNIHFLIYRPIIEKVGDGGNLAISFLYSLKKYFVEKIGAVVPEPNSSFLAGLIFGAKQSLGQNLLDNFQKVGLIHIVVLSGENLTIVATAILSLTAYFGRRKFGLIASAVGIIIFSAMVGFTTTVFRSGIMALIAIMARYLGRPADALRWLFIAGFIMLFWNPLTLFYDPSFQLSFMAALGLIIWSPVINLFIVEKLSFVPIKYGLREIVSATFAVQLFILPLLIRMSGNFSLISFVANLIVLPMIPAVMLFGFLTGLAGMVPAQAGLFLSWPFGAVSYLLSELVIRLAEIFASIPFSTIQISIMPLWLIFIWYAVYGFVYWKLKNSKFDFLENQSITIFGVDNVQTQ